MTAVIHTQFHRALAADVRSAWRDWSPGSAARIAHLIAQTPVDGYLCEYDLADTQCLLVFDFLLDSGVEGLPVRPLDRAELLSLPGGDLARLRAIYAAWVSLKSSVSH